MELSEIGQGINQGDRVEATGGPFAGQKGRVTACWPDLGKAMVKFVGFDQRVASEVPLGDLKLAGDASAVLIGGGFVFASSVSYALYLSGSAGMIGRLGAARFTALAMLVSTAATGGHFLATQPLAALVQPWPVYALGAAMGVFSTVLPVFAQSAAIRRIGSGQAALVGMVGPLLTILFAWLLLDEGFSIAQMAGAVLVIAGIAAVSRR